MHDFVVLHEFAIQLKKISILVLNLWVQYGDRGGAIHGGFRAPAGVLARGNGNSNPLRADRNGWIELSTDWEQMWVEASR